MNNSRSLAGLIAACSIALLAPLFVPLLLGRVFVYNDLSWFHLPMRYLYQQALESGDTVLWTPAIFAGFYVHGEGQIGLFHPFHQLLYRLLPLGTAFNLEVIASYPMAFGGTFWFLRRLQFSYPAALFAAMLFAFSGFNLLHHHHMNMVAVVAHMPWLLAAADVAIVEQGRRARTLAFGAMAAILASEFLLGFPQGVWWNLITLTAFGVYRAHETRRWRPLLSCGAAVALGILLGGIQLLPSADAAAHSVRAGLSHEFALTYSLHPHNLIQLWSPYFFGRGAYSVGDYMWLHEFGIYSGAILPIALIWVWLRRRELGERRGLIVAVTIFAAVTLALALGRYGGVAVLLTHVPVLQELRAPVRYIVLVQFALAILAAVTLDDLLAIAERRRQPPAGWMLALWIPAALGVATTVALNTGLLGYGRHTFAQASVAAPGHRHRHCGHRARLPGGPTSTVGDCRPGRGDGHRSGCLGNPVRLSRTSAEDPDTDPGHRAPARQRGRVLCLCAGARPVPLGSTRDGRIPAHVRLRRALPRQRASRSTALSRCGCRERDGPSRRTASGIRRQAPSNEFGSSTSGEKAPLARQS